MYDIEVIWGLFTHWRTLSLIISLLQTVYDIVIFLWMYP